MLQEFQLSKMRAILLAVAATIMATSPWASAADPFPNKPLKIIVTAAPGGTTDIATRQLSDVLSKELGQTVVVENKAGGAGIIGLQALIAAPADGYTMAMGNIGPMQLTIVFIKIFLTRLRIWSQSRWYWLPPMFWS